MAVLTRDDILRAVKADLPTKTISVPELGGDAIVRGMSGKDLSVFNEGLFQGNGKKRKVVTTNIQAKMAVRCLVDEHGARLFSDEDAEFLGGLRSDALARIFTAVQKLSGLLQDDDDEDDAGK